MSLGGRRPLGEDKKGAAQEGRKRVAVRQSKERRERRNEDRARKVRERREDSRQRRGEWRGEVARSWTRGRFLFVRACFTRTALLSACHYRVVGRGDAACTTYIRGTRCSASSRPDTTVEGLTRQTTGKTSTRRWIVGGLWLSIGSSPGRPVWVSATTARYAAVCGCAVCGPVAVPLCPAQKGEVDCNTNLTSPLVKLYLQSPAQARVCNRARVPMMGSAATRQIGERQGVLLSALGRDDRDGN